MNKQYLYYYGLVCCAIFLWQQTQSYLSKNKLEPNDDRLLHNDWNDQINSYLHENTVVANKLIVVSSLLIDIHTLQIFLSSPWTLIYLLTGMFLRQLCQYMTSLPTIPGQYWEYPGSPSLFVTYDVGNDYFFSGHIYLAMCVCGMLMSYRSPIIKVYALLFVLLEISTVVVLKGHYFMDIYAAIMTYFAVRHVFAPSRVSN